MRRTKPKVVDIPKRLKAWRRYMTIKLQREGVLNKEANETFTQSMAAIELNLPVGTYITYEQGHRSPRSAARQFVILKTEIPNGNKTRSTPRKKES